MYAQNQMLRALAFLMLLSPLWGNTTSVRLKDIAHFEGIRSNVLVGYGIVVGLDGSGDDLTKSGHTRTSLMAMLNRMGISVKSGELTSRSVAAVIVTAQLPPFARLGAKINVSVASIGSAKSLLGGTLLVTPLMGADNEVYVVAQGPLVAGGFGAAGGAAAGGEAGGSANVSKNVPTSGNIPGGGIVEKEINYTLLKNNKFNLALTTPDFTTAKRVAEVVNEQFKSPIAHTKDLGTIEVKIPDAFKDNPTSFFAGLEQLSVEPDSAAKVIINEREGVIVMGDDVKISTVAVNHGNLVISITETQRISQPNADASVNSKAETKEAVDVQIGVKEDKSKMIVMETNVTLKDLVKAFNALGVSVRDMITIIRTIKAAGALHAELEVV